MSEQHSNAYPAYMPWALPTIRLGAPYGSACDPRLFVSLFRCWILDGLTCTPLHWRRSAAFAKPWTRGSTQQHTMWWCCTTRWAGPVTGAQQ